MAGRKSFKEEIQVVKYMTELAPKTFAVIKNYLDQEILEDDSDERRRQVKADKKWATEQMIKLYSKAIPQAGDEKSNPIFTAQITGMEIIDDTAKDTVQDEKPEAAVSSEVLAG